MQSLLYNNNKNTVEPLLSDPLGGVTIRSNIRLDNRKAKITVSDLNGVGRVGLRLDNRGSTVPQKKPKKNQIVSKPL